MEETIAIKTRRVKILLDHSVVHAILDSPETEPFVQVCLIKFIKKNSNGTVGSTHLNVFSNVGRSRKTSTNFAFLNHSVVVEVHNFLVIFWLTNRCGPIFCPT